MLCSLVPLPFSLAFGFLEKAHISGPAENSFSTMTHDLCHVTWSLTQAGTITPCCGHPSAMEAVLWLSWVLSRCFHPAWFWVGLSGEPGLRSPAKMLWHQPFGPPDSGLRERPLFTSQTSATNDTIREKRVILPRSNQADGTWLVVGLTALVNAVLLLQHGERSEATQLESGQLDFN